MRLVLEGFQLIRAPIYGGIDKSIKSGGRPEWVTFDAVKWVGRMAYVEALDLMAMDPSKGTSVGDQNNRPKDAWVSVLDLVSSKDRGAPYQVRPWLDLGRLRRRFRRRNWRSGLGGG